MVYKQLLDGDIIAYQAASATDGRMYKVEMPDGRIFQEKYKKDADKLGGTVSISFEPEPLSHAIMLMKSKLNSITSKLGGHLGVEDIPFQIYLTSGGSFREKEINPLYKTNREGMRRPENLEGCKQWLLDHRGAIVRKGEYEADDLLIMKGEVLKGIGVKGIICSIDKDLKQWEGLHYNWVKDVLEDVSRDTALRNFYTQLLTGDATDGIIGLKGVGPKTAEKILKDCTTEFEMYVAVLKKWLDVWHKEEDETEEMRTMRILYTIRMTANLLHLCRFEGDRWEAPEDPDA